MMSWPTEGASIGTRMNTIMIIDMTRAICRPTNRSRTIAVTMIRPTDPPIPERTGRRGTVRSLRRRRHSGCKHEEREAEQEWPPAPEAIGKRAPDELPDGHSDHEDRHHKRQLGGLTYAE
jgi:hypothetical protein